MIRVLAVQVVLLLDCVFSFSLESAACWHKELINIPVFPLMNFFSAIQTKFKQGFFSPSQFCSGSENMIAEMKTKSISIIALTLKTR